MSVIYSRDTFLGKEAEVRVASKSMLDASDIQVLRQMFDEQEVRLDQKFEKRFVGLDRKIDLFREGLDQLDQKIDRVREELIATMEKGFSSMRDEIIDVIEDNIQPQFNTLNARVTRLERKLA